MFTIYVLRDANDRPFYVGVTSRKLNERLAEHVRDARGSGRRRCRAAPAAIAKMRERPTISKLDVAFTRDFAYELEHRWIIRGLERGWPLVNCRPSTGRMI